MFSSMTRAGLQWCLTRVVKAWKGQKELRGVHDPGILDVFGGYEAQEASDQENQIIKDNVAALDERKLDGRQVGLVSMNSMARMIGWISRCRAKRRAVGRIDLRTMELSLAGFFLGQGGVVKISRT